MSRKKTLSDLVPGGCHTYSKGNDTFPENVPEYLVKGKGAYVWDTNGKKFLDMTMGLTSVTLGHSFEKIDKKVIETLKNGLNFQRPTLLEFEMAKSFLNLVPNHQMIKFAKNGSTVTTAATKIARAYTGRELIAFPKQHPFFSYDDWFIGKTKCNYGIPKKIQDLSVTFDSCNLESLKNLFDKYPNKIACVIMEPIKPKCYSCNCQLEISNYLLQASQIVHKNKSLLIIDEMITGYKTAFPGLTSKLNIDSDITTWGKSISNGYSFSCMTGKKEVMQLGGIEKNGEKKLFLTSSTHGAETIGIRGALETLKFYKKFNVIDRLHAIGNELIIQTKALVKKEGLKSYIQISESPWLITFEFRNSQKVKDLKYHTLFSQFMIDNKILIQSSISISISHTSKEIDIFLEKFKSFLLIYRKALDNGIEPLLKGRPIKPVFRERV